HRGDFGRRVPLALNLDHGLVVRSGDDLIRNAFDLLGDLGHLASHEALDGEDGVLWVGHRLTLGDLADQTLAVLREPDHRRRDAPALGVWDDHGIAAFHHGDDRVRCSQVDTDYFFGHSFLDVR